MAEIDAWYEAETNKAELKGKIESAITIMKKYERRQKEEGRGQKVRSDGVSDPN
jgi:hypothetical protein